MTAHKGVLAIQKQARKDNVTVTVTYGGEAAGFDMDAMVNQPTPAEDQISVGAPEGRPEGADYSGKPEV